MKFSFKLFFAFYLPIVFGIGIFYRANLILGEMRDCRGTCVFGIGEDCADANTLFLYDFLNYFGIGLIILAFWLPYILISRRNRQNFPSKFLR